MIIAVASGKGGTGKTLISTNLASVIDKSVQFLDCDVEEPNAFIFLKPEIKEVRPVEMLVPVVDKAKCDFCKRCADFCAYKAIVVSKNDIKIFKELCHSCGGCKLICPNHAITEVPFKIGNLYKGNADKMDFVYGELDIARPLAVPVIKSVKKEMKKDRVVIIDSPPGASCPVVESVIGADFVLLVTEPTPFGAHDLRIAVEVIEQLKIPMGLVINRADLGDKTLLDFIHDHKIPVLLEIPFRTEFAEIYSQGKLLVNEFPEYREKFRKLYLEIERIIGHG